MSHHYSCRVVFSQEDGEWVGLCTEFPSLSHLAATHVEAMQASPVWSHLWSRI
jgi:predicted RNase H-like HicB family nuclease